MKNTKSLGLIAIVAVITLAFAALSLTGCINPAGGIDEPNTLSGTITISPASATAGNELTATYSGSENISFQWKKDGANVGTNSNKYTPTDPGSYTVTVSAAGYNPKTSAAVTVSASSSGGDPDLSGTITISPNTGVTINTELTATYSGSETVTYQWKKDGVNAGTNANKYTPTTIGSYTVTVSASGYNPKTSVAVDVTGPSLGTLSGDITINPDTGVTTGTELTAVYSGDEAVSYQWKRYGNNVGNNSNKYTPSEGGSYTVTVNAPGYGDKTSAPVDVSDPNLGTLSGTITISPSENVKAGTELTAVYSGDEAVTYRWRQDGTNVGTNSNKHTPTEPGSYTVTVSASGYNSKTSNPPVTVAALTPIANAEISIVAPVKDMTPSATATGTGEFTIGAVSWSPVDTLFRGGTVYTATVTLTANAGHTFAGFTHATVNGLAATVSNNTGAAVTLSHTFAATDARTATALAIKTQPAKLTYTHGEQLDLTGLVVTLSFDDHSSDDVAAANFAARNITADPAHGDHLVHLAHNDNPVTVEYGNLKKDTGNLTVNPKVITFTVDAIPDVDYTGSAHTPAVTVRDGSVVLEAAGYTAAYSGNINAGTATVTITGAGNYAGSTGSVSFTIKPIGATITINIKQIEDETFTFGDITISRTGSNNVPVTVSLSVENDSGYSGIEWEVAGVGAGQTVTGSGASFTLDAADINYNSLGGHALILTVTKGEGTNALRYIRVIPFTIVQ